jgi:hypothetical protein
MKKNKKPTSSLIPKSAADGKTSNKYLNKNVSKLDGWKLSGNDALVFVSLRFIQHEYQCFSDWEKVEMKSFWAFQEKLSLYTWQQVYNQSGKSDKNGLGYTVIKKSQYPNSNFRNSLSDDITLFELRIQEKMRIHGFRHESIFYACWLDKGHDIFD